MALQWQGSGNIKGPTGATGATGPTGPVGPAGADGGTTAHAARHAVGGDDALTPAAIGAAADSAVVHTTGTETINGAKTFGTSPAIPVGSLLTHPVRRDDARLTDPRTPTAHASTHASAGADPVTPAAIGAATTGHTHATPLVPNPPVVQAYSSSITPDASLGNYRVCTATGNPTLNPPTAPADGQLWRIRFIASGAQRTVTLASGLRRTTGIASTLVIPSGFRGDVGLAYETADGWTVLAAAAQV